MKKIIVVLCGILFAAVGIWVLKSGNEKSKRCTQEAIGTVVDIIEKRETNSDGDIEYKYYPVIRYEAGGKTITKQGYASPSSSSSINVGGGFTLSSSHSKYKENDSVKIFYNPDNIEEFIMIKRQHGIIKSL